MKGSRLIAVNSGILYIKMLVTVALSLYSTRIVLKALGVEDYGIYSLIGGVIVLLGFLNATMALSTQRFISFNIGNGDKQKLNEVLNTSIILHVGIALVVALILEVMGVCFFNYILNIPASRIETAKTVYHFMTLSTVFTIISVPFTALINSYEHFVVTALFDILSAIFKLAIALYLLRSGYDRLLIFGLLSMSNILVIVAFKSWWSAKRYKDITYNIKVFFNKDTCMKMGSFAGWNTIGSVCSIGRNQGVAVILNYFFGAVINAAYGIASLINSQLLAFSTSLLQAFSPQILKSEGSNQREQMLYLAKSASKFSFLLLALVSVPILIEMPFILGLWLDKVPENTVVFSRLIILITMVNQLGSGLPIILQAVGIIKWYQIVVGGLVLLILPIGFLFLHLGYAEYSILVVSLCIECVAFSLRLYFANRLGGLQIKDYFRDVIFKVLVPLGLSFALALIPYFVLDHIVLRFVMVGLLSTLTLVITIYHFSFSINEKIKLKASMLALKNKINRSKF